MRISVTQVGISPTSYGLATEQVMEWAKSHESRHVCAANVHMLMEAHDTPYFKEVLNTADLVTPDGMPLVWIMRLKGMKKQERVYGPTLMLHVLEAAAREGIPVGFYGGKTEVLDVLVEKMQNRYEGLNVAFALSPPFREMSLEEDSRNVKDIQQSNTRILFVGLGCPKQELWMAEHRGKIDTVMIGVGAAFDFLAGIKPQAPAWIQAIGLEWLYRLTTEPRRLWRRYLYNNPRFVFLAICDLLGFY